MIIRTFCAFILILCGSILLSGRNDHVILVDHVLAEGLVADIPPPIASMITISEADQNGDAVIIGKPGSVPANSQVFLVNLNHGDFDITFADKDGSFKGDLFAPAGTTVIVKYSSSSIPQEALDLDVGHAAAINPLPSTSIYIPVKDKNEGDGVVFQVAGAIPDDSSRRWIASGTINGLNFDQVSQLNINGKLQIIATGIAEGQDLKNIEINGLINFQMVFNARGQQIARGDVSNTFTSTILTPTGLPIERVSFLPMPDPGFFEVIPISQVNTDIVEGQFAVSTTIPDSLPDGWYCINIQFGFTGIPESDEDTDNNSTTMVAHPATQPLPLIRIGNPDDPHLVWMMLANTFSNTSRGIAALEDKDHFQLSTRITTQNEKFIIPRDDELTGERIPYRLEPFLPMISLGDRRVPMPPVINFVMPSGNLQVKVQKPDGSIDDLGTAQFLQSTSSSPADKFGNLRDNGSGNIGDMYELTTLSGQFVYKFQQYGKHIITMEGDVKDLQGISYKGGGTYEVYVARPLDLELGVLPGTPFEMGDTFSPTVIVTPTVAADIEIRFKLLINSDKNNVVERIISGKTNAFGYFHPGGSVDPITITGPGEYIAEITARFTDKDGVLWMGAERFGSVVETPNTSIIVHGRRGIDAENDIGQQWFTRANTGITIEGGSHINYPYMSGDIQWMRNDDSTIPKITLQDPENIVTDIIKEGASRSGVNLEVPGDISERITASELPLFSSTSNGIDPSIAPEAIDQFGYKYISVQRPDVHVREIIGEDSISTAYWRFETTYGKQLGNGINGDMPNDIKFLYGGAVFRFLPDNLNLYAIYGSLWVLLADNDPVGSRVFPPFQGNGGGPSGGPIMTLKGKEIDIFALPTGVRPGSILKVGDRTSFSAVIGPPLNSRLNYVITGPDGKIIRPFSGQANKIGYFYDEDNDFIVDKPGLYEVAVDVAHDGLTSAGQVQEPFPAGDVLGSRNGRFNFYVVENESDKIDLDLERESFISPSQDFELKGIIPSGLTDVDAHFTTRMPGFILEEGALPVSDNRFTYKFSPRTLHNDFPNIDTEEFGKSALVDTFMISFFIKAKDRGGKDVHLGKTITLQGEHLLALDEEDLLVTPTPVPSPTPVPQVVTTVTVEPTTASRSLSTKTATVTVLDQSGGPIQGVTVTATVEAAAKSADPVVTPISATTNSDGEAEFGFRFPFRTKGGVITFTADGKTAEITQK